MGNGWTPERRQRQAAAISQWKPWERSTGPRTVEGKAVAGRNGWKGGMRPMLRELAKALRGQEQLLDDVNKSAQDHAVAMRHAAAKGEI
ncbi:hypothetical protein IMW82_03485 [Rhodanobacter sp. B2A1Ga4]|uniref:hypothetical protein n=1 Tax=Rhodanobacter sp. B2A1Ga4 TaxID=2778647 RepID=UPI001B398227|nr:hypothetical protein [Rhodanobacter sp. B2A1Ga4]MBQ4853742.1 hypothetical protein [Rhodanobacter sp. B2A1Ga4]